jgi:hypothetical protein
MSRNANPGELRTPVRFVSVTRTQDSESYYHDHETTVLETWAKWVNAHGSDAFSDAVMKLREPATLTLRYSALIRPELLVYKGSDPVPFEIISMDNVDERGFWMELHVQRMVSAR